MSLTASEKRYRKTAKWRAVVHRSNVSAKGHARQSRYKKSEKGKANRRRYESTEKYKAAYLRYRSKPGVRLYYRLAQQGRNKLRNIQEAKI